MKKVIVIAGPTATGKTSYSIELAKKINGEIISADSRQVYCGINLLSGKVTKKEMGKIPHYLIDVANPKTTFSVDKYKKLADKAIEDIFKKGKTPIICGGTGFYIDAILYDRQFPEVPPNKELRAKLVLKSSSELFSTLIKLDPARAKTIDAQNPVRLIRAIEIAKALGKVPKLKKPKTKYEIEWITLDFPDDELKNRIHIRLLERIKKGMIREAQKLHTSGVSFKKMESLGLECRSTARFLQSKISKEELVKELENDIWHYVKRQRTWFKKYGKN